ncbi:MAG: PqqD family protein [Acidimicrobiia bacterium]|jgi:hypothetical protein
MAWQRSPRVVYEVVDGQAVLVDPEGVELLTLNAVGTLVWEELDGVREAADLAAALVDRLDGVEPADLVRDIAAFLDEIRAAGLVDAADDPSA